MCTCSNLKANLLIVKFLSPADLFTISCGSKGDLATTGVSMEHIRSSFTVICISTVMWFHTQLSYNLSRKIACARDFSWLGKYCDITAGC